MKSGVVTVENVRNVGAVKNWSTTTSFPFQREEATRLGTLSCFVRLVTEKRATTLDELVQYYSWLHLIPLRSIIWLVL